jgi:hypothetical protein
LCRGDHCAFFQYGAERPPLSPHREVPLGIEVSPLRRELIGLQNQDIMGNAYSDRDLLSGLWDVALRACSDNEPTVAFDALDYLGVHVMGEAPMEWQDPRDGFVANLTQWHKEIA